MKVNDGRHKALPEARPARKADPKDRTKELKEAK